MMGRVARKIPRGKFFLRQPSSANENQQCPVTLYYYCGGKQIRQSTSIMVSPKDWNQNADHGVGEIKASHGSSYKRNNVYLKNMLRKTDSCIIDYVEQHGFITPTVLKELMKGDTKVLRKDSGEQFITFARNYFRKRYDANKISCSTYKNNMTYLNMFERYLQEDYQDSNLYIGDLTEDVVDGFSRWGLKRGRKPDTVVKYIQTLSVVSKYAASLGYIARDVTAAIADASIINSRSLHEERTVKYLTEEEMSRFTNIDRNLLTKRQTEVLEMFFFSFYACGLRISDVITLRWEDVDFEHNLIRKVQIKTSHRNTIPINAQARAVLEQWRGKHRAFVFGLLPDNFDLSDGEELRNRRNSITATFNKILGKLSSIARLEKKVTFHVARHTWAVLALAKGAEVGKIGRLLGHSSTEITERVYAEYLPETLADTVDKLKFDF